MLKLCGMQVEYLQITKEGTCTYHSSILEINIPPLVWTYSASLSVQRSSAATRHPFDLELLSSSERANSRRGRRSMSGRLPSSLPEAARCARSPGRAYGRVIGIHRFIPHSLASPHSQINIASSDSYCI